jgi:hypothetical protein
VQLILYYKLNQEENQVINLLCKALAVLVTVLVLPVLFAVRPFVLKKYKEEIQRRGDLAKVVHGVTLETNLLK